MLSSDKNVESVAQLIEVLKDYIGLQKEYLKFDVIDKMVRMLTALTISIILFVLTIAILFYLSFAAVYWMALSQELPEHMPLYRLSSFC